MRILPYTDYVRVTWFPEQNAILTQIPIFTYKNVKLFNIMNFIKQSMCTAWRVFLTYLAKLARFWMTLAMRVSVREVRSSGYSCMRLKSEGDMMAGHRKRRKSDALIRRWLMSCFPRAWHCCFHDANTSFSSRGNTLTRAQQQVRMELMRLQAWTYEQTTNKRNEIVY